jgi:hypothetical protein
VRQCKVTSSKGRRCDGEITFWFEEGVCTGHHHRMRRLGRYDADRPIRQYTKGKPNNGGTPTVLGSTPSERFWNLVVEDDFHFQWNGTRSDSGLPTHWDGKVQKTAAQFMWIELNGSIPKGARVKKTCEVMDCINPDHLYLQGGVRQEVAA